MSAAHDCVERINGLLKDRNTVISVAIPMNQKQELIQIATSKADSGVRGRPVLFFASFCPFCGIELNKDDA